MRCEATRGSFLATEDEPYLPETGAVTGNTLPDTEMQRFGAPSNRLPIGKTMPRWHSKPSSFGVADRFATRRS